LKKKKVNLVLRRLLVRLFKPKSPEVLSKSHAMLLCKDSCIYIVDTGSSNGTFLNNVRLSKAGKESAPTEVFTGDIIKFGSEVEDKNKRVIQKPVVAKITIFKEDRVETRERLVDS
jgi:pSer/pThr/pTyr-binding forkhead associated (FHA) protein